MTAPIAILFEGPQTIATVDAACARLREAMADAAAVAVDVAGVTEADLAFVQVLLAARRSAVAAGKGLSWRPAGLAGPVAGVLTRAGVVAALFNDIAPKGEAT